MSAHGRRAVDRIVFPRLPGRRLDLPDPFQEARLALFSGTWTNPAPLCARTHRSSLAGRAASGVPAAAISTSGFVSELAGSNQRIIVPMPRPLNPGRIVTCHCPWELGPGIPEISEASSQSGLPHSPTARFAPVACGGRVGFDRRLSWWFPQESAKCRISVELLDNIPELALGWRRHRKGDEGAEAAGAHPNLRRFAYFGR